MRMIVLPSTLDACSPALIMALQLSLVCALIMPLFISLIVVAISSQLLLRFENASQHNPRRRQLDEPR